MTVWAYGEGCGRHGTPVPMTAVHVSAVVIGGFAAVVKVRQTFHNGGGVVPHAVVRYALDPEAAVCGLHVRVGDKVIKGTVLAKAAAKKSYDAARAAGRTAVMVHRAPESAGVFEASLGALPAGVVTQVELTYVTDLPLALGKDLTFVVPAKIAGFGLHSAGRGAFAFGLDVHVTAASELTDVRVLGAPGATVTKDPEAPWGNVAAVRAEVPECLGLPGDVVVTVRQAQPHQPRAWYQCDPARGVTTAQVVLYPDAAVPEDAPVFTGKYVFMLDRSGSMSGWKILAARNAVELGLQVVPEGAGVQVVFFGSEHRVVFEEGPVPCTVANVDVAVQAVRRALANMGGTELLTTLADVFRADDNANEPMQVILLTDGEVGNTQEVVDLARRQFLKTGARVFVLGVGSEVDRALVQGVAGATGAAYEYVPSNDEAGVVTAIQTLVGHAQAAPFTHVRVDWGEHCAPRLVGGPAPTDVTPIHPGKRVVVYAEFAGGAPPPPGSAVTVHARDPHGADVAWELPLVEAAYGGTNGVGQSMALAAAWARLRVLDVDPCDDAVAAAVTLSTSSGVVCRHTALLAVAEDGAPVVSRNLNEGRYDSAASDASDASDDSVLGSGRRTKGVKSKARWGGGGGGGGYVGSRGVFIGTVAAGGDDSASDGDEDSDAGGGHRLFGGASDDSSGESAGARGRRLFGNAPDDSSDESDTAGGGGLFGARDDDDWPSPVPAAAAAAPTGPVPPQLLRLTALVQGGLWLLGPELSAAVSRVLTPDGMCKVIAAAGAEFADTPLCWTALVLAVFATKFTEWHAVWRLLAKKARAAAGAGVAPKEALLSSCIAAL
jgi:hypothetical protein